MADDGDRTGTGEGGGSGGLPAPVPTNLPANLPAPVSAAPQVAPMASPWFPAPYAPPMYMPLPAASDKSELKLSDATPAQVRAELGWLVSTAKQNRMAAGVTTTCYRLLLLILNDLEATYRPKRWWFAGRAVARLKALQKAGAVTRAVVDEGRLIQLEPTSRVQSWAALMGDPAEAQRYVAFLRMLVDVAYEARAKYRKAQQPPSKSAQGMTMSVTVGPQSGGS